MNATARAPLTLIACERGYGKLTPTSCAARWKLANATKTIRRAVIDDRAAQLRASRCVDCPHGAARERGEAVQAEASVAPRFDVAHVAKLNEQPKTKPCKQCGAPFEYMKDSRDYCSSACRHRAEHERQRATNPPKSRLCAGGCGKSVQTSKGQQRWCYAPCKPNKYAKPPKSARQEAGQ